MVSCDRWSWGIRRWRLVAKLSRTLELQSMQRPFCMLNTMRNIVVFLWRCFSIFILYCSLPLYRSLTYLKTPKYSRFLPVPARLSGFLHPVPNGWIVSPCPGEICIFCFLPFEWFLQSRILIYLLLFIGASKNGSPDKFQRASGART